MSLALSQCAVIPEGKKLISAPGVRCTRLVHGGLPCALGADDSYVVAGEERQRETLHFKVVLEREGRDQGPNISFKETFPMTLTSSYEAVSPDISSTNQWQQPLTWAGLQIQAMALW